MKWDHETAEEISTSYINYWKYYRTLGELNWELIAVCKMMNNDKEIVIKMIQIMTYVTDTKVHLKTRTIIIYTDMEQSYIYWANSLHV